MKKKLTIILYIALGIVFIHMVSILLIYFDSDSSENQRVQSYDIESR